MRHYFIVGNHKMNLAEYEDSTVPRQKEGLRNAEPESREREHRQKLINILTMAVREGLTVVLCPTFTRLDRFTGIQNTTGIAIGAQNCHWEQSGANSRCPPARLSKQATIISGLRNVARASDIMILLLIFEVLL